MDAPKVSRKKLTTEVVTRAIRARVIDSAVQIASGSFQRQITRRSE